MLAPKRRVRIRPINKAPLFSDEDIDGMLDCVGATSGTYKIDPARRIELDEEPPTEPMPMLPPSCSSEDDDDIEELVDGVTEGW